MEDSGSGLGFRPPVILLQRLDFCPKMGGCQNYGPFFGVPNIVRHLLFRVPQKDPNFDNHPNGRWDRSRITAGVKPESQDFMV